MPEKPLSYFLIFSSIGNSFDDAYKLQWKIIHKIKSCELLSKIVSLTS